jgi:hypothetical protein
MLSALALNVIGGILAGLAFSAWSYLRGRVRNRRFKAVFGPGVTRAEFALIYEELALRSPSDTHPYFKPDGDPTFGFSISHPVPVCTVRALNYVAGAIGQHARSTPAVTSDIESKSLLDLDFVCFGGPGSNHKTLDCMSNAANTLAVFDQSSNSFVHKQTNSPLVKFEKGFDYGLILKIRPTQFPNRVWISCAGLGEWGTSGAAWFVANKWNEIRSIAGDQQFAVVIRVRPGQDESAEMMRVLADKG